MSLQTEQRGFTIGRQVGGCGRCTRFVLGLLGLISTGRWPVSSRHSHLTVEAPVVAFPSLLFRRQCTVYCPLNAIDLVERRGTYR
jgi:hypothetical protein